MRKTWAICRKELQMYFYSPTAYVAFAFYFLINGFLFTAGFISSQSVDVRQLFGNFMMILLFIIPLLTMRLVSDELRQGTDELLLTSPASITEIVAGKYLAAIIVQALLVGLALVYPLILSAFGPLDQPVLWLSYLSLFLLGAAMMAVGLFASSLSAHQMVSGIAGFCLLLLLWLVDFLGFSAFPSAKDWLGLFSLPSRTANLQKGVFDLPDVLFFATLALLFLALTIQTLERKRWR